ncbi:MAG: cell division protein FtsL [Azospirillum brasilense]|nr:MAG: cell division protein FtsL [Azospirillum brasilense]
MSFRLSTLISWVCVAIAAFGIYLVKYTVQDVQRDVVALKTELAQERESLHLLNAEWAYLNRPERLRELSDRHLALAPMDSRQIQDVGVLPAAIDSSEAVPDARVIQTGAQQ